MNSMEIKENTSMTNIVKAVINFLFQPVGTVKTETLPPNPRLKPEPMTPRPQSTPRSVSHQKPTAAEIQNRAYQLWQKNGRRHGNDQNDWYQAEKELLLCK